MLFVILAMESDNASIVGMTYVIVCLDVGMNVMLQFDLPLLKRVYMLAENCMPLKLKEIHLINMSREGLSVLNFVTSFILSTWTFKFMAHKRAEDLLECIPRDALTVEYGGENDHLCKDIETFGHKLLEYMKHFSEDGNFGTMNSCDMGFEEKEN